MTHKNRDFSPYDKISVFYDERWEKYNQAQIDWVLKNYPVPPPKTVLDVGCGSGLMLAAIQSSHPDTKLSGVDKSSGMLSQARKKLSNEQLIQGDIEDSDFMVALPRADLVLSLSVLQHLKDIKGFLKSLDVLTNKGGTIILSSFAKDRIVMKLRDKWLHFIDPTFSRSYSNAELDMIIKDAFPNVVIKTQTLKTSGFWDIQIKMIIKS